MTLQKIVFQILHEVTETCLICSDDEGHGQHAFLSIVRHGGLFFLAEILLLPIPQFNLLNGRINHGPAGVLDYVVQVLEFRLILLDGYGTTLRTVEKSFLRFEERLRNVFLTLMLV